MFGANAGVPTSIANEVGGTTPVINLSMNFREANKNTTYMGGSLRMDGRSTSQFWQFNYRAAGSTSENLVASLSSAGVLSTGYHYITGVDGNSRSLVSLASGNSVNSIVWGQALSNNNSAALIYTNAATSTVQLGIYGGQTLSVDGNGIVRTAAQFNTGTNTNTAGPTQGTNGGVGDRYVLWPGGSGQYPFSFGNPIQTITGTGVGIFNTAPMR